MTFTDDSDRANYIGSIYDTFGTDPMGDYDPMHADAPGDGPKCGGCETERGCRHCSPPDAEAMHTGFETYDRPDFYRVRRELVMLAELGYALHPRDTDAGRRYFERTIGFNRRLQAAAQRKMWTICDESETHAEALERYAAWAGMVKARIG